MSKPKIGLLGLMTDGYEPIFPGITARQEAYARELVSLFSPVADVDFPGAVAPLGDWTVNVHNGSEQSNG